MTYPKQRILRNPISRSQFCGLALIISMLVALQAAPASAQTPPWTTADASGNIKTGSLKRSDGTTQITPGERFIGEFASFAAAISEIGATSSTLVINTAAVAGSSVNVPSTVVLRFTGAGSLSVASGVVVTMATAKIIADPHQQIFMASNTNTGASGTGKVRFTAETPVLSVMWWGAKGDGPTTDDTVAIKAALASVEANISGENPALRKRGAILEFPIPSTYYRLSSTLDVRQPLWIRGTGTSSGNANGTVSLRWNTATIGLRIHRYNTSPGYTGTAADGAILEGLELVGTYATSGTATVAGTANVSGLTVTRTTGPNYNEDFDVHNTITINGYEYVVQTVTNANSLTVYKPRLRVAVTNGSKLVTYNGDAAAFYPTGNWNLQAIKIDGVSYTISSHTARVINLTTNYTGPTAASVDAQVQSIATLTSTPTILNKMHGILDYSQVAIRDVVIRNWSGDGINMNTGITPFGTSATDTNANNSHLERAFSLANKGSGILTQGTNSNNIIAENFNGQDNRGAGIMDSSFLGNTWIAPHLASNRFAPYFSNNVNGYSTVVGMYTEDGQPSSIGSQHGIALGGDQGSGWTRPNMGFLFPGARLLGDYSNYIRSTPIRMLRQIGDSDGTMPTVATSLHLGETTSAYSTVFGFGAGNDTASLQGGSYTAAAPGVGYRLGYNVIGSAVGPGWWSLGYNDPTGADLTKQLMAFSGSAASSSSAKLWLPNGIHYLGSAKDLGLSRTSINTATLSDGSTGKGNLILKSVQLTSAQRPTCDSTTRFTVWAVAGGRGVADTFEVCRKDAADVYAWVPLPN